jgi:hypothetical protein
MWSKEVLRVNFSGKASDKPVSAFDPTPCYDRYANRVSEIWYGPKEAMRTGQIKGLCAEAIQEICMRKKSDEKGLTMRIKVETKADMKNHSDRSPDIADSAFGLYDLCCERLGLSASSVARKQNPQMHSKPFKKLFARLDPFAEAKRRAGYALGRLGL